MNRKSTMHYIFITHREGVKVVKPFIVSSNEFEDMVIAHGMIYKTRHFIVRRYQVM